MESKRQQFINKINNEHLEHTKILLDMDKEQILKHADEYCVEKKLISMLPDIGVVDIPDIFLKEGDYDVLLKKDDLLKEVVELFLSVNWDDAESFSECFIEIARCDQDK